MRYISFPTADALTTCEVRFVFSLYTPESFPNRRKESKKEKKRKERRRTSPETCQPVSSRQIKKPKHQVSLSFPPRQSYPSSGWHSRISLLLCLLLLLFFHLFYSLPLLYSTYALCVILYARRVPIDTQSPFWKRHREPSSCYIQAGVNELMRDPRNLFKPADTISRRTSPALPPCCVHHRTANNLIRSFYSLLQI